MLAGVSAWLDCASLESFQVKIFDVSSFGMAGLDLEIGFGDWILDGSIGVR